MMDEHQVKSKPCIKPYIIKLKLYHNKHRNNVHIKNLKSVTRWFKNAQCANNDTKTIVTLLVKRLGLHNYIIVPWINEFSSVQI
jgi:hypothetical protein